MRSNKFTLKEILLNPAIITFVIIVMAASSSKAGYLKNNYDIVRIENFINVLAIILPPKLRSNFSIGPNLVGQMKPFRLATTIRTQPDISWKNAENKKVTLKTFDGKVVLLNFWASWCQPCLRELPSINRLQAKLGGNMFTVVALNTDRGGKTIAARFKRKLKLNNLNIYTDKINSVAKTLKIRVLPTTIIFDANGREVGKMEAAAEWDTEEALSLIQYFINNPNHADKLGIKNVGTNQQNFLKLFQVVD